MATQAAPATQATKSQATTIAPATPAPANGNGQSRALTPIEQVGQQLELMTDKLKSALPAHIPVDRFKRVVLTAVNLNPKLLNADRRSLFNAASKAASDGLVPDGREGALVIYNTKMMVKLDNGQEQEKWVDAVQWMPMTQGVIKLIRQSGEISAISARCVYEEEVKQNRFTFRVADGEEHLTHDPILFGERGKLVGVYAAAKFKDGTVQYEPLTLEDLNKIKNASKTGKAGKGPWIDWYDEMCRKSAVRRLRKYLPTSGEDLRVLSAMDRDFHETEIDQARALAAQPQSIMHAAAALSAPTTIDAGDGETADAETGEIMDAETTEPGHDANQDRPIITHIPCPEIDGNAHWRGWADTARNAIPLLEPGHVAAWRAAHADELAGLAAVSKKLLAEVEADLAAKAKEAA
jgi:phage RecT family recombinase